MKVMVINGPNLGRLDIRDSTIYGDFSYPQLEELIHQAAEKNGLDVDIRQSDDEAELVRWIHEAADTKLPVILNPAAFTHYSIAIRDAAELLTEPLIEVHLSNPIAREEFRHTSFISGIALGTISGFGPNSYVLAISAMKALLSRG